MIPEIGLFALILALCLSCLQFLLPCIGHYKNNSALMRVARPLSMGQCFFVIISFLSLALAFYADDFSLIYVVRHSNSALPLVYKLSAVWAGHEGSLLLWVTLLSIWTLLVSLRSEHQNVAFVACNLAVLGAINAAFLFFLLTTSSPFSRWLPHFPIEGNDLNPLLQDLGLIIHPPILYMGYVGFAIPFAFAISCLLMNKMDKAWVKWVRPFALIAWCFLTLGIALGSWWAYYELGWGGWWFWDPVENASFMPWLAGIALLHCLIVNEKREKFQIMTLFIAITCFMLSLLGTFLVRSGILTSVHSFASDPKRGILLFKFLLLIGMGSYLLLAIKGKKVQDQALPVLNPNNQADFAVDVLAVYSRESLISFSSLLLLVTTATILLGTLFPVLYAFLTDKKISVGFPYFNKVFVPLMLPVLLAIPLGPFTHWGQSEFKPVFLQLRSAFILSLIICACLLLIFSDSASSTMMLFCLSVLLGLWVCFGTLQRFLFKMRGKGIKGVSSGAWAMCLAHFGMGVMIIGVSVVLQFQIERDVKIAPRNLENNVNNAALENNINKVNNIALADYQIIFKSITSNEGSNFVGYQGEFAIERNKQLIATIYPEKRIFATPKLAMTETAIDPGLFRDIYIALGERLADGSWTVRVYYKPFVRWIWFGAILMALGAMVAALGKWLGKM